MPAVTRALIAALLMMTASGAAAQDRPDTLYPWEARWFERWGTSVAELNAITRDTRDATLRKLRVGQRFREMIVAGRNGDGVAQLLVGLELNRRCNGGKKLSVADCGAWRAWMLRTGAATEPASRPVARFRPYELLRFGDRNRMLEIGRAFEYAEGVPVDYALAAFFYQQATSPNNNAEPARGQAHYRLGQMYERGLYYPRDRARAYAQYHDAARLGQPDAAYLMAIETLRKNPSATEEAGGHFWTAAKGGNADAAYRYAMLMADGKASVPRRKNVAPRTIVFGYFQQAALAGHVPAMTRVASWYHNGIGVPRDLDKALDWYQRAARAGDPEAAWYAAGIYSGRGDYPGGLPWLKRAAQGNYPGARALLAQWQSKGVRERSLLGALLSVFEFIGDVGTAYQAQQAQQIAASNAFWANYTNVGSWNADGTVKGSGAGGGASGTSGGRDAPGAESGADDAPFSNAGGRGGDKAAGGQSGGAGGDILDAVRSTDSAMDSNARGAVDRDSGGSGSVGSRGTSSGLIIEEDKAHTKWLAEEAQRQRDYAAQEAREKAQRAAARAESKARYDADMEAYRRRKDAEAIACWGSLERAKTAKASCQ